MFCGIGGGWKFRWGDQAVASGRQMRFVGDSCYDDMSGVMRSYVVIRNSQQSLF